MWRPEMEGIPHWIQGTPILETPELNDLAKWENKNPATEKPLGWFRNASPSLCHTAVEASYQASLAWQQTTPSARSQRLHRLADLLQENQDSFAQWETQDTGRPIREILAYDIPSSVACLRYFGDLITTLTTPFFRNSGSYGYGERVPFGVCLGVCAWNYPLQIAIWKLAPALAAGNTMILKPSEWTPLSTTMLASLTVAAGFPPGVVQVVHGTGPVGQALLEHPLVRKVSLTGSVGTGKKIAARAGQDLKAVTLELGGKSPLIICEDAPMEQALNLAMLANFYSNGQICSNGTRVFVPKSRSAEFLERLIPLVQAIKIGDPLDPTTTMGPLIHKDHRTQVLRFVQQAQDEGATKLCGGEISFSQGYYMTPVVLADCNDSMTAVREEIFGPVMSVLTYETRDEVIQRANATPFGLGAGIVSADILEAQKMASQLQAGMCWINTYNDTPLSMPFGGMKHSGLGRENGLAGLESYSQWKSVIVGEDPVGNLFH